MMTEYDQRHIQQGYQKYGQNGYQQFDQRGYQQYDQRNYPPYEQRGYQQEYDPHDPHEQQQSQARSTILERGRAIRLMRNGDPFFTGRNFVINQKKYPMLEVFMDDASKALRANFGAVRSIYTPKHGTRLHDISDFEDHQTYVAAGGEKFKKLHYLDIAEGKRISSKGHSSPKVQLPSVRRPDVEGRAMKLSRSENIIIHVYRNGDPLTLPAKVLLVKSTLQSWESVLDEITKKVTLPNTAVLKLYAMNGELITSARQIDYNGMYVAAGKERFKRVEYPDPQLSSPNASPKISRKHVRLRMKLPPIQRRTDGTDIHDSSQTTTSALKLRYAKSDGANTYTNTANSYGSTENPAQRRPVREDYDFFNNNKPQQHRRGPTKETDLDRDDGGIYKGRLTHREYAHEVDETRDTKVDIPIDYKEAETVHEEALYGNARKNVDRHHQQQLPSLLPSSSSHTQSYSDSRLHPIKTQPKTYDDDDAYQYSYSNSQNKGYGDDYHYRNETPVDDEQTEQQLPHSSYRQPLISSSTQAQFDEDDNHENHQEQNLDSNIDQNDKPLAVAERGFDNNTYKT